MASEPTNAPSVGVPDATDSVLAQIRNSYAKARAKHAPMHSAHEGYAVLLEEVDELWDEVKRWQPKSAMPAIFADAAYAQQAAALRKEALHVAAMALAFILEVCDGDTPNGQ